MDKVTRENIGMQFCSDWLKEQILSMIDANEKLAQKLVLFSAYAITKKKENDQLQAEVAVLRETLDGIAIGLEEDHGVGRSYEARKAREALAQTRAPLLLEVVSLIEQFKQELDEKGDSDKGEAIVQWLEKYREAK